MVFIFKEEIKAETVLFIQRTQPVNKIHGVEKVSTVRKSDGGDIKKDNSFEEVLTAERKRIKAANVDNKVQGSAVNIYNAGMNYYNNKAMGAYFYMTPSTADFKG